MSTNQFASSASAFFQRFLNEARETARLTGSHIVGLKQYGVAEWQARRLSAKAFDAQAALGAQMHLAGQGDAAQRARIAEVEERLRSLKAAQTKSKATELELRAEHARLAELALAGAASPPGAEAQFESARAAREDAARLQEAAAQSRTAVRPAEGQKLRIGVGYLCLGLVLVSGLWAFGAVRGIGSSDRPDDRQISDQNPTPLPGPDDNGPGPTDQPYIPTPPETVQQPVYTPSPQLLSCSNCYGTGQSDCTACFGKGTHSCYACNGAGQLPNPANNFLKLQCFQCNGTGQQDCTFCQYGKVQCPQCQGRGQK